MVDQSPSNRNTEDFQSMENATSATILKIRKQDDNQKEDRQEIVSVSEMSSSSNVEKSPVEMLKNKLDNLTKHMTKVITKLDTLKHQTSVEVSNMNKRLPIVNS